MHSRDREQAKAFAVRMPASRIPWNVPATQGCCGVLSGLAPSFTLGCGTFGGTSTTDNVTYTHLRNVKRMAEPNYEDVLRFGRLSRRI